MPIVVKDKKKGTVRVYDLVKRPKPKRLKTQPNRRGKFA